MLKFYVKCYVKVNYIKLCIYFLIYEQSSSPADLAAVLREDGSLHGRFEGDDVRGHVHRGGGGAAEAERGSDLDRGRAARVVPRAAVEVWRAEVAWLADTEGNRRWKRDDHV